MKILITTDLFVTPTNGVVTSVKNLRDELQKRGHDVRILTISGNRYSHKEGNVFYIRSLPIGVYPDVRMPTSYRHKLIKELIGWKPDIIHSQCEFFSYQFALKISKATGAPIVHTCHTLYEDYVRYVIPVERFGKWLVRKLTVKRLSRVETVIVPTKKIENLLLGYGVKNKMFVVPSGICLEQHKKPVSGEEIERKRRELGIPEKQLVLLNLGRLGEEKNVGELLTLFAESLKENEDMVFLIVGGGPSQNKLQQLSVGLGIGDKVIFTGMVDPSEVHLYYRISDIFVSASTSETQGLTYVEAMANGLPLLCRKDECLRNVLVDGKNGYGYTDGREFIGKLNGVFRSEEWREEAGRQSQTMADLYDKSTFAASVEKIYYEVCKNAENRKALNEAG